MEKLTIKRYVPIAVTYSAAVGALFLFGYWGSLGINVLEYISLSDLMKLSLYPLVASLFFFLVSSVIAQTMFGEVFPPGGGRESAIGRALNSNRQLLAVLNLVLIFGAWVLLEAPYKWFMVTVLASNFSVALADFPFFVEMIPNHRARQTILWLALMIPGLAFYHGSDRANSAKLGQSSLVVDVARSKLKLQTSPGRPVVYLGYVGGFFVVVESSSGTVVFVKPQDDSPIFLTPNIKSHS